jgi:hypothetical protein
MKGLNVLEMMTRMLSVYFETQVEKIRVVAMTCDVTCSRDIFRLLTPFCVGNFFMHLSSSSYAFIEN